MIKFCVLKQSILVRPLCSRAFCLGRKMWVFSILDCINSCWCSLILTLVYQVFTLEVALGLSKQIVRYTYHLSKRTTLCLVAQSRLILCSPMDCNPLGYSVHGDFPGKILGWVAMPSSRGSSQPRDQTQVFGVAGRFYTIWATREAPSQRTETPKDVQIICIYIIHIFTV